MADDEEAISRAIREQTEIHARLTRIEVGIEATREILRESIRHGDNASAQLVALLSARVDYNVQRIDRVEEAQQWLWRTVATVVLGIIASGVFAAARF